MVVSGYGLTRPVFDRWSPFWVVIRDLHVWLSLLFTFQVFFHVFVTEFRIRSKWFSMFRRNWRKKGNQYLLLKVLQKVTGYTLLIISLLLFLTGLNFHLHLLDPLFLLLQHVQLDTYLRTLLIVHVALGAKMVFIRTRLSNLLTDLSLLVTTTAVTIVIFYLDTLSWLLFKSISIK